MNDKFKNRKHQLSFKQALAGIYLSAKTQPNLKIISLAALVVLLLGTVLGLNQTEWAVIVLTIGLVYIAEMINTSIEAMVDLITTEWREDAKIAKDIASGMVLMSVFISVFVGLTIFFPKIRLIIK